MISKQFSPEGTVVEVLSGRFILIQKRHHPMQHAIIQQWNVSERALLIQAETMQIPVQKLLTEMAPYQFLQQLWFQNC